MTTPFDVVAAGYERGRWWWAVQRAVVVVVVAVPALLAGAGWRLASALAVVLAVVATVAGWRSRAGLHGALLGALGGVVPLVVGAAIAGHCSSCGGGVCLSWCGLGCGLGSAVVGVVAGLAASRVRFGLADFAVAFVCCSAAGVVLCPLTGVGSVVGAVVGVVVGAAPVLVLRRRSLWAMG